MKIIMPHADLFAAVAKLQEAVKFSQNRLLFYPSTQNGEFILVGGNHYSSIVAVTVSGAEVDNFDSPVWVDYTRLSAFLNAIHAANNITINGAGTRWKFSIGQAKYSSAVIEGDSFHLIPLPGGDAVIVKARDVANFARVGSMAAKDYGAISGAYMIFSGEHLTCMATDRFGAGYGWFELTKRVDQRFDSLIPASSLSLVSRLMKDGDVSIFVDNQQRKVHFVNGNIRVYASEMAEKEKFPADALAKAMRADLDIGSDMPAMDLVDKLSSCSAVRDDNEAMRVSIVRKDDVLSISSHDNTGAMTFEVPVLRSQGDPIAFNINPKFIQSAVALLKQMGEVTVIRLSDVGEYNWVFVTAEGVNARFSFAKMHPQG